MTPTPVAMAWPITPRRDVGVLEDVRRSIEAELCLRRFRRGQQEGEGAALGPPVQENSEIQRCQSACTRVSISSAQPPIGLQIRGQRGRGQIS